MGQNFLIDRSVLAKIIDAGELSPQDTVLEIGPGLGILTLELARKANRVIAVEKDDQFCKFLSQILNQQRIQNVDIINQDILSYQPKIKDYKLIANLPYYITSPVIRKFLESENQPRLIALMIQKEVAQRIVAQPPNMNILAIAVQIYAQVEIIDYVSKQYFWPVPKVDSAIIKIKPFKKPRFPNIDYEQLFKLIKQGFSSKRKMLKNNLQLSSSMLEKIGINPKARAENLSIDQWVQLYAQIN